MAGKKELKTDAEVKSAVDSLLGQFGVVGEADGDFGEGEVPVVKDGGRHDHVASGDADALWGNGAGKKK